MTRRGKLVVNCGQTQVKPEHIILACADNTCAIDNLVWGES